MERASQDFEAPADWPSRWWEVPFDAVLRELRTAYVNEVAVDSDLVDALDDDGARRVAPNGLLGVPRHWSEAETAQRQ